MKKKLLTFLAVVLLLAAAWVVNAFTGNPASRLLARRSAQAHIEAVYPDLRIEDVRYSFKDGKYHAFIVSDTSRDTHFTLYYNGLGQLHLDTYKDHVASGWNTIRRLDSAYQLRTDPTLKDLPYEVTIGFCQLNYLFPGEESSLVPALRIQELILDQEYDISRLGESYGQLILYLTVDDISPEAAAELLLDLNAHLEALPFFSLDLTLQQAGSGEELYLRNFPRADILPEGLEERILENHRRTWEEYAKTDKEPPLDQSPQTD